MIFTLSKILISSIGLSTSSEESVSLLQLQAMKKHQQEPTAQSCKESRKSLKEQKAAFQDARKAFAEAKQAFIENKEVVQACKKEPKAPKLPAEMCGLTPGEYTVTYYSARAQTGHFECDGTVTQKTGATNAWASYAGSKIACDEAGLNQRCKSGSKPEPNAIAYVMNTWGNGKYECLYMDGDDIVGKHYVGMNAYWGPITYGANEAADCSALLLQTSGADTPPKEICKAARSAKKELRAALKAARKAKKDAKVEFRNTKEIVDACKPPPKLPSEMCGLAPGVYSVKYYNARAQTGHFECDGTVTQKTGATNAWASYAGSKIACDEAGLNQRCKSGSKPEPNAIAYVMNTWGNGKYECLYMDGDNIVGKHYVGMNAYWGPITYGAKERGSC